MYHVHRIHAFSDNYIWALVGNQNKCAIVDPGEAKPVLATLANNSWELTEILLTHHHPDHIGGVKQLVEAFPNARVVGPDAPRFSQLAEPVFENGRIRLEATGSILNVTHLFGHTRDHIGYFDDQNVFVGDTLFSIGCGRLFEGTAVQLFESLQKLKSLPDTINVYCAHEYTLSNLEFALTVEPDNPALRQYQLEVADLLANGESSIPTTIGREKKLNPFLRAGTGELKQAVQHKFNLSAEPDELQSFTLLRQWKDSF